MMLKGLQKLKKLEIAVVCHEYTYGPPHALNEYLVGKAYRLTFIAHPFVFAKNIRSYAVQYDIRGKKTRVSYAPSFAKQAHLSAIKDFFLTLYWSFKYGPFDCYIGVDGLSACVGILFKFIGRTKRVIFYTIDYVPQRFSNTLFNTVYHGVDRMAVWGSDCVWNVSQAISDARSVAGYPEEFLDKQMIVPIGAHRRIQKPFSDIKKTHAVHMGHIIKKQGVQLMLEAMPVILQKIPNFHFHIVGSGDYEPVLKDQTEKLHIYDHVTFHGYIEDHRDVEKILSDCSIGIATYEDTKTTFAKYADPGKIKIYLACSLPVIVTQVPSIWKEIQKNNCGITIRYSTEELVDAVCSLLQDEEYLKTCRNNAYRISKRYTYDNIFNIALNKTAGKFF